MKALDSLYPMYVVNAESLDYRDEVYTEARTFYTFSEAEAFAKDLRAWNPSAKITISRVEQEETYADCGQAEWRCLPRTRVVEEIELPRMCQVCGRAHITGSMYDIECPSSAPVKPPTKEIERIDTGKAIERARARDRAVFASALRKEEALKRQALEGALWQYEPTKVEELPPYPDPTPMPTPAKKPDNTRIGIVAIDIDFDDDKD